MNTSKNSDFFVRARKQCAESRSLQIVNEDSSTKLTLLSRKKCVFRDVQLFMGKHCYIDDLVTASAHRSKGYGEKMIAWLRHQARQAGCDFLHLDSGTHRGRAHKFYFDQGFTIASYHFSEALK